MRRQEISRPTRFDQQAAQTAEARRRCTRAAQHQHGDLCVWITLHTTLARLHGSRSDVSPAGYGQSLLPASEGGKAVQKIYDEHTTDTTDTTAAAATRGLEAVATAAGGPVHPIPSHPTHHLFDSSTPPHCPSICSFCCSLLVPTANRSLSLLSRLTFSSRSSAPQLFSSSSQHLLSSPTACTYPAPLPCTLLLRPLLLQPRLLFAQPADRRPPSAFLCCASPACPLPPSAPP